MYPKAAPRRVHDAQLKAAVLAACNEPGASISAVALAHVYARLNYAHPFRDCNGNATDGCESNSNSDVRNCGSCGNVCDAGDLCCNGDCVPEDERNCGACGDVCGSGQACCGGECVGVQTNDAACGRCGNPCLGGTAW